MLYFIALIVISGAIGVLFARQASISVWTISYAIFALLVSKYFTPGLILGSVMWVGLATLAFCSYKPLRQKYISNILFKMVSRVMPTMSRTEREALEAGSIGWEGDLFGGSPDFNVLRSKPISKLTKDEQAFLDGPVVELSRMLDDWDITHERTDLSPEVWEYIKSKGFFGMIIPKQFGGLEFSATAVKNVLITLYGRSITAATTVGVPNSLGPAELLLKYGTKAQQDHYLPRLANGREVPCFALTGPTAGSDAASIPDMGTVCKKTVDDKEVIGIKLNWNKRYITLAPVATVIGLAFRLFDPEHLIGDVDDVGISCALIPANTPGVTTGRRHFPLNNPFMNGPTQGKDVFIPLDYLIGGAKMAGQGWRMLMECLSAGRAISLPSSAVGGAQAAALATGAYARIRKQFNQPIGKFEGIEEALARIAGNTYIIDSSLTVTASAIDQGEKSAVAGAILKYHTTEMSRDISKDAMDIHGGKGICLGPNNYLGRGYEGAPISITVEGANILTRSLIIFGQGAIRCHPYVLKELESIRDNDRKAFDRAIWGHGSLFVANFVKTLTYSFTGGRLTSAPKGFTRRYYQLINQYSANLVFLADFSMMTLGANLKRKESLSARLGDVLSYLYLISCVLRRFEHDGEPAADRPLVDWSCQYLFHKAELAIQGLIVNMPMKSARMFLKTVVQPFGLKRAYPSDRLGQKLAKMMITPNETRDRLTHLVFKEALETCPIGKVEETFNMLCSVEALERTVSQAQKAGKLHALGVLELVSEAESKGVLTAEEAKLLYQAETARLNVIAVDDFAHEALARPTAQHSKLEKAKKAKGKVEAEV